MNPLSGSAHQPRSADPAGDTDPLGERDVLICSAKSCRNAARYALNWNNPKLHAPDRRKTWLACADHRESLAAFLSARGFLRDVESL